MKNILVTGGAGFIGSNFIRYLFGQEGSDSPAGNPGPSAAAGSASPHSKPRFAGRLINLDKLTYAGNPANLADIEAEFGAGSRAGVPKKAVGAWSEAQNQTGAESRPGAEDAAAGSEEASRARKPGPRPEYHFQHADICDAEAVLDIFRRYQIDTVVHFAAESHVDRSIFGPRAFVETNVTGTLNLLEAARATWKEAAGEGYRFHHVSTDEVYGSLGPTGYFTEDTPYDPRSPYSASKASSDHLVRAYHHTYELPVTITNCSNNYGPYQFPEKLIPVMILNMRDGKPLPIYGDGKNIRDWLYVDDHSAAIWQVLQNGTPGRTYNVGGRTEKTNLELVHALCDTMAKVTGAPIKQYRELIAFVTDRPGHDRRYAIDCGRIERELGWAPATDLSTGLEQTVRWYLDNTEWIESIQSGEYREWIEKNYGAR